MNRLTSQELLSLSHLLIGQVNRISEREIKRIYKISRKVRRDRDHPLYSSNAYLRVPINLYRNLYLDSIITERGCWIRTNKDYYGQIPFEGRMISRNRLSYFLMKKDWNESRIICHFCDTKNCVNFLHLFSGSQADNMRDYRLKIRQNSTYTWICD